MSTVALVTGRPTSPTAASRLLVGSLRQRGVQVTTAALQDRSVDVSASDLAVLIAPGPDPLDRESFLDSVRSIAEATSLSEAVEVLRWNSHRSYLLELEERGAPVVPTAWAAQGDRIDLAALLAARGWSDALLKPAVRSSGAGLRVRSDAPDRDRATPSGSVGSIAGLAAGQRHLDDLLAVGDALVQPYLGAVATVGRRSVVVVDGQVSHTIRHLPAPTGVTGSTTPVDDGSPPEIVALARWVVDATGVDLFAARVDLIEDELGAQQVIGVEVVMPELYLDVVPAGVDPLVAAVLRRLTG